MSDPGKPEPSAPGTARRFYTAAAAEADAARPGAFAVKLDGRELRTPKKERLSVPTRALAEAIAAEWDAQGERIDPKTMPLTRLVNSIIDGVRQRENEVRADLQNFAANDLLCYRAEGPETLVARQARAWDEILSWARSALGARLYLGQGVMPVAQPEASLEAVSAALAALDAYRLAALHVMTTLTGSILLGLAVLKGRITPEDAWARAHVDEDWQMEQWGVDAEAAERRERRWREMRAAARLLELLNQP
jgi:chaperone required for assembly of F1-ATPase